MSSGVRSFSCLVAKGSIHDKRLIVFNSKPSTFVEIKVNDSLPVATEVSKSKSNPKWDEEFKLNLTFNSKVTFSLCDIKHPARNSILGSCVIEGHYVFNASNENTRSTLNLTLLSSPSNSFAKNLTISLEISLLTLSTREDAAIGVFKVSRTVLNNRVSQITNQSANTRPGLRGTQSFTVPNHSNSVEVISQNDTHPDVQQPNVDSLVVTSESLPVGWELKYTSAGRPYYVDHNTSTTTWERPVQLPSGWERRVDNQGRTYYVDHNTRTTTWQAPTVQVLDNYNRFRQDQNNIRNQLDEFARRFQYESTNDIGLRTSTNLVVAPSESQNNLKDGNAVHILGQLPDGWEQRYDIENKRYFYVDHYERETSWHDPRLRWLFSEMNPLPDGYSVRVSPEGIPYFVCHKNRTTTYVDPRTDLSLFPSSSLTLQKLKSFKEKSIYFRHLCTVSAVAGTAKIPVSRENIFEDSFNILSRLSPKDLRKKLFVAIKGEAGLDYGGVSREWFFLLSHEIMNPMYCLFQYTTDSRNYCIQINPSSGINPSHLDYFRFIGRVLGLALYHRRFIDHGFNLAFYKNLLGIRCNFNDLQIIDPQLYNSLLFVKENSLDECGLEMYFCTEIITLGEHKIIDLKPDGRNILVTNENKNEYIRLLSSYKLYRETNKQMNAIWTGFGEIIPITWVKYFDEKELELLLCGMQEYDINDWKKNTTYRNGYNNSSPQIIWFWKFVESLDFDMQARLLQFSTGSSRLPVGGFSELLGSNTFQKFCIEKWGNDDNLPRSHTCFNRIDLPPYTSEQILRSKLTLAITETGGFFEE